MSCNTIGYYNNPFENHHYLWNGNRCIIMGSTHQCQWTLTISCF